LPSPEWFNECRLLHLNYGIRYDEIQARAVDEDEKQAQCGELWYSTNQELKRLHKQAMRGLRCTATKPNGERCTRSATPDYIGQRCSSHAPNIREWPDLEETRRLWPFHEYYQDPDER
jgi:hypothetical protein